MKSQDNFCRNLKAALELRGMSQAELARRMGTKPPALNQYAVGRVSPGLNVIDRIAESLDIPADWLISDEPIEHRLEVHV